LVRSSRLSRHGRCPTRRPERWPRILRFSFARYGAPAATIGDAGAVCAVLDPSGLETTRRTVRLVLTGPERGRLVDDPAGASVDLAVAVDGRHYANVWLGAFG
jgi:pyrimidine-specific ribonucleoside hydrolase